MNRDIPLAEVKEKSLAGVGSLFRRQLIIKTIFLGGNVLLARILAPQIFGIYAIVVFVVQFFSTFGNVGLGAALIQKKGELSGEELSTAFWFQQMLVGVVAVLIVLCAPLALLLYPTLPSEGIWLIRAMALGFVLTSLKSVPAILMERSLDFKKIAKVDILENIVFYATAIPLAIAGFEAWSFIIATIVRSLVGAVAIYALSPWRPSMEFHFRSVDALVKFGIPYQLSDIVNFAKDAVTPLFVGAYAGNAAVGYLTWAKTFAFAPMVLSEGFGRVAFPAFSRIQEDKSLLQATVELSIRSITLVMLPLTALMLALAPDITRVVFTAKWLPGLNAFYFFCTSPCIIGIMLPLYSAILSLGKSKILLKMSFLLLLLEWLLGVPLVMQYGYTGVAMTQPVAGSIFFFVYMRALKSEGIKVRVYPNIKWQLLSAAVVGGVVKCSSMYIEPGLVMMFAFCLLGSVFYAALLYLLDRKTIHEFLDYLGKVLVPSKA